MAMVLKTEILKFKSLHFISLVLINILIFLKCFKCYSNIDAMTYVHLYTHIFMIFIIFNKSKWLQVHLTTRLYTDAV